MNDGFHDSPEALAAKLAAIEREAGAALTTTPSGLRFVTTRAGEGARPGPGATVRVHYTGWLVDGRKFDSSRDRGAPATFPLSQVIAGWTEGVGGMQVGERRTLVVPPDLGYGRRGMPPVIPRSAHLIFDVELLAIV